MNYNNMTKDDFDRILYARIKEENLESIVNIPGVYEIVSKHFGSDRLRNEEITGRVPELLINSEKASTSHVFNEYIERFLRFQFSMIQTHDQITQSIVKIPGVYEIVSKHFNNDILEMWEYEQYIKVKDIVEKIGLWNPEFQRTSVLLKLLNELTEVLYGTLDLKLDKYVNLRALPVREFFKDVVDKYSDYPIWTCDFEGSCLVGAEKFEIEPVDSILQRFEGDK